MIYLIFFSILFSQSWFNHPELNWHTFETDHFIIHYHDGTERSAREAAYIAENIYFQITSYYEFEPSSKTHIIVKDINDYANGAAYFFDNKIEISALPLDFRLRGSHRWLQNVITHEFTHIVQIGASMKASMRLPLAFFQVMGYEKEKRKDVLYGYPNTIISYPIPNVSVPPWFAEGTAQFMYPGATKDFWDTNRDMILRDRVINNNLLSFDQMNNFGNKGMGNESVYSQGFAFCKYLVDRFGNNILPELSKSISNSLSYSINSVFKKTTGVSGDKLYVDWKLSIDEKYYNFANKIEENVIMGDIVQSKGNVNISPVWSPNGEAFTFLSNRGNESFFRTDLYIYQFGDSTTTLISKGVKTAVSWKDNFTLLYSKLSKPNLQGSIYFDIYEYDLVKDEENRLTNDARLVSPIFIPGKNKIVAINNYDGTSNILVSDMYNIDFEKITNYNDGSYISSIAWINNKIIFDLIDNHGKNIFSLDLETLAIEAVSIHNYDEQNPAQFENGMISSIDKSGIFNLYIKTDEIEGYVTNVKGGAFMPTVSNEGRILYSLYENASYKIAILDSVTIIPENIVGYNNLEFEYPYYDDKVVGEIDSGSEKYKMQMTKVAFMPKILLDYNTIKPGIYCSSYDLLNKVSLFGALSINDKKDLDVFLNFEYSNFTPTIYANLFWITRHQSNSDSYYNNKGLVLDNINLDYDLTFLLFAGELGLKYRYKNYKFWLDYSYSNYRQHINQHIKQTTQSDVLNFYGDAAFDYYRGHGFFITCKYDIQDRKFLGNILPQQGLNSKIKAGYEWNNFMDGFAVNEEYSTFGANFKPNNTFRVLIDLKRHSSISRKLNIATTTTLQLGWISNKSVDDFFYFFSGGETGLKGYTFYEESLTGPSQFIISNAIRLPVFSEKNYVFKNFTVQNFIIGIVNQFGGSPGTVNAFIENKEYKISSGIEARISGFSFYSYPTAIEYSCHIPISESSEYIPKQYLKILFNF